MFSNFEMMAVISAFIGFLFLIAFLVERRKDKGVSLINNPWIYSLSLSVYCTTWTFYGSVGNAASSGFLFITIYLGPTLCICLWPIIMKRLLKMKDVYRVTSIADLIVARYGKSQRIGTLVTTMCLIGIIPYIALQIKGFTNSFGIITGTQIANTSWNSDYVGPVISLFMIVFTIMFGIRKLDPSERHPGMMMALTIEAVVKLFAFVAVGVFVVYKVHDGFGDIFSQMPTIVDQKYSFMGTTTTPNFIKFFTYTLLAASAILFLPRQFHVGVVENPNPKFLKTAMWMFPLYLFLINIFVLPIAIGGLLEGGTAKLADSFVLKLPLDHGLSWLSAFVFIGGFSAGTGMVMIETMAVSAMVSNYLFLPLIQSIRPMAGMKRHLLEMRWLSAFFIIISAYIFQRIVGEKYPLVAMGVISFAAVLQFAPAILFGLFWGQGSVAGAFVGLASGFGIWLYTLLIPAFMKGNLLPKDILDNGLWGLSWLKPESLFGLEGVDFYSNSVIWSMIFNIGGYVVGSLVFPNNKKNQELAEEVVNIMEQGETAGEDWSEAQSRTIGLVEKAGKEDVIIRLLSQFFSFQEARNLADKCFALVGSRPEESHFPLLKLTDLYKEVERNLAASIGAGAAHLALQNSNLIGVKESESLSKAYGDMLANLKISPRELTQKINFYQDRQDLLQKQAAQLEDINKGLEKQVEARTQEVRDQMKNTKVLLDNIHQAVFAVDENALVVPPVSEHTHQVLGVHLGSRNILDTLFKDVNKNSESYAHVTNMFNIVFGEDLYQWDMVDHLLPRKITYQCITQDGLPQLKTLKLSYQPIADHDSKIHKVLFVVEDITEILRLENEKQSNLRQIEILQNLSHLEETHLHTFFKGARQLLDEIQVQLAQDKASNLRENMPLIMRNLHTMKGNARVYGLNLISTVTHEVESELSQIQKMENTLSLSELHKHLRRFMRAIQTVVFEYSRSALKYLHFESDFEAGFFDRLHQLICEMETASCQNSGIIDIVEEIADIVEQLALSQSVVKDLKDFAFTLANDKQASNLEERRHQLLHFLRTQLLERRLLPPFETDAATWTDIIVKLAQISTLIKAQTGIQSDTEWRTSELFSEIDLLAVKSRALRLTWLSRHCEKALARPVNRLFLNQAWTFVSLFSSMRSRAVGREKDMARIRELFASQEQDARRLIPLAEELMQNDNFLGFVIHGLARQNILPRHWLASLYEDTGGLVKDQRFLLGSELDDDVNELFSQPLPIDQCLSRIKQKKMSNKPLDLLLGKFFQPDPDQNKASDFEWTYLKSSEISRMIVACTLEKQPYLGHSRIQTMEVITAHVNQVKKLCQKYRQDPHSFSADELTYSLERLHELPVKPLFDRFYPMVQELANKYGKKIHFEVIGEELGFHREKFNLLSDMFVHLIRNAIDHAIEPVEDRKRLGKEEIGRITVECSTDRYGISFVISDDGRGINPEEVGTKALSQGLISQQELILLDINAKRELIFLQGMSTKTEVNEISGRGVGLDVVKVNIALLNGSIDVNSEVGCGTRFTIVLRQEPRLVPLEEPLIAKAAS